jgi:predicted TIM-barrel fold metal-dependent hydrolase
MSDVSQIPGRRTFLKAAAGALTGTMAASAAAPGAPIPIIDTHIHLYDPTRPQGTPYPPGPNPQTALPDRYRREITPIGVVGGIKVEASPWVEDNLWVLDLAADEPIIVGVIGNLDPLKPEFSEYLERYHRNKLFLGIRYGNIWHHDLVRAVEKPDFIANMKTFAATGLTYEAANPRLNLMEAVLRLTDSVPDLRVMLGHLQALALPTEAAVLHSYTNNLRELKQRGAYAKISGLIRPAADGKVNLDPAAHKPMLDFIWDIFGEDRIVYASGWPTPIDRIKMSLDITRPYVLAKGREAAEKFFWRNSIPAYRWVKRNSKQPQ